MKISKEDFLEMKGKYDKEVKKGKPGKNKNGQVDDQTNWVFFNRETLERVLAEAGNDPLKGGIQFFITEYSEKTAKKYHPNNPDEYEGRLTLVMKPIKDVGLIGDDEEGDYENTGVQCPPSCP
ncbi:molecular chaperone DnaK [Algoriphagus sp.]|uniref:molecular chaperone DnaK n=1 Tax=Algoriphagus sp. TaxID=1872435 RepID=UPI002621F28D|nr:molecular chaperone DnaK [Algoriphagus sp.]